MASSPILAANDAGQPVGDLEANPLDDSVMVRVDQIDAGERLRPVDAAWAEALGAVMLREGQRTPIEVCRLPGAMRWTLVTGGHRLAGAMSAGIAHLRAIIVGANRAERRMAEVSENLWRRELEPIDRAAFLAELVALKRAKLGDAAADSRAAKVNIAWKQAIEVEADGMLETISSIYGWTEEIGDQIGLSGRTVRNDLMLYRRLQPSLVARLRDARHPVARNATQLRVLAKLEPRDQERVVDLLLVPGLSLSAPTPRTVGEALASPYYFGARKKAAAVAPDQKRLNTILSTLRRMPARELTGLFQAPVFHGLIPAEARKLLAPMLRDGRETEEGDDV